jgi:hypothetical protein
LSWSKEWQQQMREWTKRRKLHISSYPEWQIMNDIKDTLKEMEEELSQKSFWDNQNIYLELEQDWVDELHKAVEK